MGLEEMEEYLKTNRHLPGIKSAAEYQQTGTVNLGELNIKLLEKVEELMLYNIELMKQIKLLEKKMIVLEKLPK
ncbi:MAG: hypothetical protein EOP53_05220 [Sphingobacteriales bacterium]|nr:MAG: hypothetical protein EOP53_05220 [Sphingobacteriales bacterium]